MYVLKLQNAMNVKIDREEENGHLKEYLKCIIWIGCRMWYYVECVLYDWSS